MKVHEQILKSKEHRPKSIEVKEGGVLGSHMQSKPQAVALVMLNTSLLLAFGGRGCPNMGGMPCREAGALIWVPEV